MSKMVGMRWFDYERKYVFCMKRFKEEIESNGGFQFDYESDFDMNGLIFWIGTNGLQAE
jgi:E3 ubiquitin-protein ligase HECTD1